MSTEDKFTFNIPFKANESMKGFSFGYRGVASDMDGQTYFDSLPWDSAFWKYLNEVNELK